MTDKLIDELKSIPIIKDIIPFSLIRWLVESGTFGALKKFCCCCRKHGTQYAKDGKIYPEGLQEAFSDGVATAIGEEIEMMSNASSKAAAAIKTASGQLMNSGNSAAAAVKKASGQLASTEQDVVEKL